MKKVIRTRPIFFCVPVVLASICYCTSGNRLINKCNTTGGLEKFGRGSGSITSVIQLRLCVAAAATTYYYYYYYYYYYNYNYYYY